MVNIGVEFTGSSSVSNESYYQNNELIIPYPCSISCECSPYLITLPRGKVSISLFGASGGYASNMKGGKGGMIKSIIRLDKTTKYYLYIGGKGANMGESQSCGKGGYNGGGESISNRGGGGGATDLRTSEDNLSTRILVAGGGGCGYKNDPLNKNEGGDGGGYEGETGSHDNTSSRPCIATQEGCKNGVGTYQAGIIGKGSSTSIGSTLGGGGGGYYGGGSGLYCGSSGGSSYSKFPRNKTHPGVNIGDGYAVIYYIQNMCTARCRYRSSISFISICIMHVCS